MTINKNYIDYLKSDIDFTRQYYIKKYNNLGLEIQTNQYIQNRMNILVSYLKNHKNIKYIILDYKDDMLSYINYSIVSNCFQFLNNNYKLLFFGKIKKTKDYIYNYKQDKILNKFNYKKYINNSLYISGFNPMYKVNDSLKISNKFPLKLNLINLMSSDEIRCSLDFFQVKNNNYSKDSYEFQSSIPFKLYTSKCLNTTYKIPELIDLEDNNIKYNIFHISKNLSEEELNNIINNINSLLPEEIVLYYIEDDMTIDDLFLNPIYLRVNQSSHAPNNFNIFYREEYHNE